MTQKNDGGPAFPQLAEIGDMRCSDGGMTLRDWFAGQAIAGMAYRGGGGEELTAHCAYKLADAMLAKRNK